MTFSLIGRCADTGALGMVVTSSSLCVASRCAWARAGIGVVATQNLTDPRLGDLGLDLLAAGMNPQAVIEELVAVDPHAAYRQLMVLDSRGVSAAYTGEAALPIWSMKHGFDCAAAGNMLDNPGVPEAMIKAFESHVSLPLGERLLLAVEAGLDAGGEVKALRSTGLKVVENMSWPTVDLRVDMADKPLSDLRALWSAYQPLKNDYVGRAHSPHLYAHLYTPAAGATSQPASTTVSTTAPATENPTHNATHNN